MVDIKNMAVISKLRVHEKWHQQFIRNFSGWVGVTFIVCLVKGDRRSMGICFESGKDKQMDYAFHMLVPRVNAPLTSTAPTALCYEKPLPYIA